MKLVVEELGKLVYNSLCSREATIQIKSLILNFEDTFGGCEYRCYTVAINVLCMKNAGAQIAMDFS